MKLYCADICNIDEKDALYPALSGSRGSSLGVSLLAAAYDDYAGGKLPLIKKLMSGKPVFTNNPELHFSISHSRSHVLCALSSHPVGVDTQVWRNMRPEVIEKLTTEEERENLNFFDIWVLRESLFKLVGQGDLRTMRFYRSFGKIVPPIEGVQCRLYKDIPDSSTGVCTFSGQLPDRITNIPISKLLKKQSGLLS